MAKKKPNLILIGIDSLRADHMSLYGYERLTTPHIDDFAAEGTPSSGASAPTSPPPPATAACSPGRDCFGTDIVALRHKGPMAEGVPTLAEILREQGYESTCVGFNGNPASRGFDNYLDFAGWGSWEEGRSHKAENLNDVALPELKRLAASDKPFFLFLRHMDPHSPYLPPAPFERMFYARQRVRPGEQVHGAGLRLQALLRLLRHLDAAGRHGQGLRHRPVRRRGRLHGRLHRRTSSPLVARWGWTRTRSSSSTATTARRSTTTTATSTITASTSRTLHVPLIFRYAGKVPAGLRVPGYTPAQGPDADAPGSGRSSTKHRVRRAEPDAADAAAKCRDAEPEFYITECTWMRKHGWRTPEWKLILALEPDFHFKPEVELYNLIDDPEENDNLAKKEPDVVALPGGAHGRPASPSARRRPAAPTRCSPTSTGTAGRARPVQVQPSRPTTRCTSATPKRRAEAAGRRRADEGRMPRRDHAQSLRDRSGPDRQPPRRHLPGGRAGRAGRRLRHRPASAPTPRRRGSACPRSTTLATMLAALQPDICSVATGGYEYGSDHYEPTMQALEAGCHVLGEKPISNEIAQAEEMVATARENGPAATASTSTTASRRPRGWPSSGWTRAGSATCSSSTWRMWIMNPRESSPYFQLKALHPHTVDVMRYFCGDIEAVQCFATKAPGREHLVHRALQHALQERRGRRPDRQLRHRARPPDGALRGGRHRRAASSLDDMWREATLYPGRQPGEDASTRTPSSAACATSTTPSATASTASWSRSTTGVAPEDIDGSGADGLAAQKVLAAAIESVKTERIVKVQ